MCTASEAERHDPPRYRRNARNPSSNVQSTPAGQRAADPSGHAPHRDGERRACRGGLGPNPTSPTDLPDPDGHTLPTPVGEREREQFARARSGGENHDRPSKTDRGAIAGGGEAHPAIAGHGPRTPGSPSTGLHHLSPRHRLQRRRRGRDRAAPRHREQRCGSPAQPRGMAPSRSAMPSSGRTDRRCRAFRPAMQRQREAPSRIHGSIVIRHRPIPLEPVHSPCALSTTAFRTPLRPPLRPS